MLFVSQPAVTRTIRELEICLGVPRVTRSARGAALTGFGQAFSARARLILEEGQRARDELAQLRSRDVGRVRFAASSLPAAALLSPAVQAFRRDMPLAELRQGAVLDRFRPVTAASLRTGRPFSSGCCRSPLAGRLMLTAIKRSLGPAIGAVLDVDCEW